MAGEGCGARILPTKKACSARGGAVQRSAKANPRRAADTLYSKSTERAWGIKGEQLGGRKTLWRLLQKMTEDLQLPLIWGRALARAGRRSEPH